MSPLEFLQRLAALVPPPRLHLIRCHGALAPNARLRARVVPQGPAARGPVAGEAVACAAGEIRGDAQPVRARAQHIGWAQLLERVFDFEVRRCPSCGAGALKIIPAILQRAAIGKILSHLGLDPRPPPRARAREAGHETRGPRGRRVRAQRPAGACAMKRASASMSCGVRPATASDIAAV